MFIINPLHAHKRDNLFATHPATENRIAALRELAGQGTAAAPRRAAARADSAPTTSSRIPSTRGKPDRGGPWN